MSHVSVIPMAKTGGDELSSINVVWIKGSFHLFSPLAAGEILLPFSRSSLETDSGNLGWINVEGQLERVISAAVMGLGSETSAVAMGLGSETLEGLLAGYSVLAPSPFLESQSETPLAFPISGEQSPPSCSPEVAIKKRLDGQFRS